LTFQFGFESLEAVGRWTETRSLKLTFWVSECFSISQSSCILNQTKWPIGWKEQKKNNETQKSNTET